MKTFNHYGFMLVMALSMAIDGFTQPAQDPVSLDQVIKQLEEERELSFSYESNLLDGFSLPPPDKTLSNQEYLAELGKILPFEFEQVNDKFVIVKRKKITLKLTLTDEESEEQLPGVYIKLNDQYLSTVSDDQGNILLDLEWTPTDLLAFEFVGYEKRVIPVIDLLQSNQQTIELKAGTTVLNELVITSYLGNGISAIQSNHSIEIDNGELGILPGDVSKDPLVSLRTLPGVSSVTGRAGELRIRGGTPDQNLLLFNNIPIFHKGYFFGTVSPFSTDIIDQIRVYRSGYAPRLGGSVGGAIEISSAPDVPEAFHAGVTTNTYFASTYFKVPLINDKLGVSFSARSSHPFDYESPIEKAYEDLSINAGIISAPALLPGNSLGPVDFDFWDVNGSLVYQDDQLGDFSTHFLSINNTVDTELTSTNGQSVNNRNNELDNLGFSGEWRKSWPQVRTRAFGSWSSYTYDLFNITNSFDNQPLRSDITTNQIDHFRVGGDLTYEFDTFKGELTVGYDYTDTEIDFRAIQSMNGGPETFFLGPVTLGGYVHGVHANFLWTEWEKLMVDIGIRGNYYVPGETFRAEPRLFMNYFLSDRFTFKSSFGLYSQQLTQNLFFQHSDTANEKLIWFFSSTPEDPFISSWQALVGGTYQHNRWMVDVDLYRKEVDNVSTNGPFITLPDGTRGPQKLVGELESQGMDVLIKYQIDRLNIWGNYTLSRTTLYFPLLSTEEFPSNYDQTHMFNLTGTYQVNGFRASLGWSFSTGIPNYLDDPFFPSTGPQPPLDEPRPVGEVQRFGNISQADASVAYEFKPRNERLKITLGASVLNLLDRENLLERTIQQVGGGGPPGDFIQVPEDRNTIGFAPDFMLRVEF